MITISAAQLRACDMQVDRAFRSSLADHIAEFSPVLAGILGEQGCHRVVECSLANGRRHGFERRGPLKLYLELTLLRGSWFDTDPQYRPLRSTLLSGDEDLVRAETLRRQTAEYAAAVAGPGAILVADALERLQELRDPAPIAHGKTEFECCLEAFEAVYPEKLNFIGRLAFGRLDQRARGFASRMGARLRRSHWSILALMLAFGHGCMSDPLYPWISGTLEKREGLSPDDRIAHLERKGRRWLSHVLMKIERG